MKKTVFVAATALAVSVMTAPLALAQESPADCAAAVTALNRADQAHRDAVDADEKAREALDAANKLRRAERALAEAESALEKAIAADNEAGLSADSPATVSAKVLVNTRRVEVDRARVDADKTDAAALVREARKTDAAELKKTLDAARADFDRLCGSATPTPTPDPTPTPSPDPEPEPDPNFVDLDCKDFPLADGRTAQQILNETPNDDPHGLDADKDRIACEPGQDTAADSSSDFADSGEVVSGRVARPSGGVSTGVGPA